MANVDGYLVSGAQFNGDSATSAVGRVDCSPCEPCEPCETCVVCAEVVVKTYLGRNYFTGG